MPNEQEKGVVEYISRDNQKIKLSPAIIKKYLVSGNADLVTPQELYLYMGICKSRGLNPFIRDCYLIKYSPGDNAAIVVSIDYYRKRARAQTDCRGWKAGITLIDKNGELQRREGCLLLDGESLVGAWFEALPDGWDVPMKKEINLKPYIKTRKDGKVTQFWSPDKQPEQITKVVESQGLRATWPDEFQGLYTDAERESMESQAELSDAISTENSNGKDAAEKLKSSLGEPEQAKKAPKEPEASEVPEPVAKTELSSEEQELLGDWNPSNWKNLRKPGFVNFIHSRFRHNEHKIAFNALPPFIKAEIVDKWNRIYEEPFPDTKIQEPEQDNETQNAQDPEAEERLKVIGNIKSEFDETVIFQAKAVAGFPTGGGSWPPSLDGVNYLYDKCIELNEGN